jgi:hypothetical protein
MRIPQRWGQGLEKLHRIFLRVAMESWHEGSERNLS